MVAVTPSRVIPAELRNRYESEGWWTAETLGAQLSNALAAQPDSIFRIYSEVRPYTGTFGDVERIARRLAAGLRSRGVGPGDVIAFQLPNWVEAAVTFWASSFLGRRRGADRALLRSQGTHYIIPARRGRRSSSPPSTSAT